MTTLLLATALAAALASAPAAAQEPSTAPARPPAAPAEAAAPAEPRPPAQPARPATAARPAPARPAVAAAPAVSPAPEGRRRNVSIEVAISDQAGTADPVRKVVSMIVADRQMGRVRSSGTTMVPAGNVTVSRPITLNVDAQPTVLTDDSIQLWLTIEYRPTAEGAGDGGNAAQVNEQLTFTLDPGKPLVVSRATDPGGHRKVAVEVTATVMK